MAETTKIEWADATLSLWWGCTKVSPACANCYAETWARRWGKRLWGPGAPRERKKGAEALARRLNRQAEREGRRLRVFSASMSDWLDPEVPAEWLADLLALIEATPNLDWLLLSKRPHLWRERLWAVADGCTGPGAAFARLWVVGTPPPNVWLGCTVEDQEHADERIPALLATPARVRFLSCEPLLGPVDLRLRSVLLGNRRGLVNVDGLIHESPGVDWIIAGGESGRGARPSHPDWFRSLRDQAVSAGVAFFFKQWGEWAPGNGGAGDDLYGLQANRLDGLAEPWGLPWYANIPFNAAVEWSPKIAREVDARPDQPGLLLLPVNRTEEVYIHDLLDRAWRVLFVRWPDKKARHRIPFESSVDGVPCKNNPFASWLVGFGGEPAKGRWLAAFGDLGASYRVERVEAAPWWSGQVPCDCEDCDGTWCVWCLDHHGGRPCPVEEEIRQSAPRVHLGGQA